VRELEEAGGNLVRLASEIKRIVFAEIDEPKKD
jgi:hypothetical protein